MANELDEVFATLGIPNEVKNAYLSLGLKSLYDWQRECLYTTNVLRGSNLVYCAPTSGGKTLIAELVLLKVVLNLHKKAIFVLPYVSLVLEKERHLKKMIRGFNSTLPMLEKVKVKAYCGDMNMSKKYREDIIICTIEKANSILNTLIRRQRASSVGCLVLDETHVLGNAFNGYLLEILVSKVLFSNRGPHRVQVVALSATMGNVDQLAHWLQAKLYRTTFRPIPLHEYIKVGQEIMDKEGNVLAGLPSGFKEDPDGLAVLVKQGLFNRQQIIIFCPTKVSCSETCALLGKVLGPISHVGEAVPAQAMAFRQELLEYVQTNGNPYETRAREAILAGMTYHHAALDAPTRERVEAGFLQGHVSLLCATSTLAAGVNLPAGRVIIRSLTIGKDLLTVTNYKQMSGRAGRAGQAHVGESFLVVKPSERDRALALVNQTLPDIHSQMNPYLDGGNAMLKALIEVIGLRLCCSVADVQAYIASTLWCEQLADTGSQALASNVMDVFLKFLVDTKIIQKTDPGGAQAVTMPSTSALDVSRLGRAIVNSNFHPDEAIILYEALLLAQDGLSLDIPLHLLYLVSPLDHGLLPDFKKMLQFHDQSQRTSNKLLVSIYDAVGMNVAHLSKWQIHPPDKNDITTCTNVVKTSGIEACLTELAANPNASVKPRTNGGRSSGEWHALVVCKRLWAGMILQATLDGQSEERICYDYSCTPQELAQLRSSARIMTQKTQSFCKEIGWTYMERIIKDFKSQLLSDVPKEIRHLLAIPKMSRKIAKILVDYKLHTPEQLVNVPAEMIVQYLQLSMGFELQDLSEVEMAFQPESSASLDAMGPQEEKKASAVHSRDEVVRIQLMKMAQALLECARTVVKPQTSEDTMTMMSVITTDSDQPAVQHEVEESESDELSSSSSSSNEEEEEEAEEMEAEGDFFTEHMDVYDIEHERPCFEDAQSPLAKVAKLSTMSTPKWCNTADSNAWPVPQARSVIKKVAITPIGERYDCNPRSSEHFVSDEDLLQMMLEMEANGFLYSSETSADAASYTYIPISDSLPLGAGAVQISVSNADGSSSVTMSSAFPSMAMETEETSDEALLTMMDAWEQTQAAHPPTVSQEITKLVSKLRWEDQPQIILTPSAKSQVCRASPYITPYTASKISSPGNYLYYPLEIEPLQRMPSASAMPTSMPRLRHLLTAADAGDFLQEMKKGCFSFELVFKCLPKKFLACYKMPQTARDALQTWSSLLSSFCSAAHNVTCQISDVSLADPLQAASPNNREVLQSTNILVGVVFYAGGDAFYLALPCPLPQPKFSTTIKPLPRTSALDALPMKCKEKIIAFIGFGNILHKSAGLHAFMQAQAAIHSTTWSARNPMMVIARNWCLLCRHVLAIEWRKGAAVEWTMLQDIMGSAACKIACNMKMKLVMLRERDVLLKGRLDDPTLAVILLSTAGIEQQSSATQSTGLVAMDHMSRGLTIATQRAVTVFHSMVQLEQTLDRHGMLRIYSHVEAPLLHSVADLEQNGMELDSKALSALKRTLQDRNTVIEQYFHAFYSSSFSLDSFKDVRKVKESLIAMATTAIAESNLSKPAVKQIPGSNEKKRSDWSTGKDKNKPKERDEMIQALAREHPLWKLISEYHSQVKTLPTISSSLACKRFGRVRPFYSTLGTETGRIIANQPPIQQFPKQCSIVRCPRPSIHQELQSLFHTARPMDALQSFNMGLQHAYQHGQHEWVKVSSLKPAHSLQGREHVDLFADCSLGKLLMVLDCNILQPCYLITSLPALAVMMNSNQRNRLFNTSSLSLMEQWCGVVQYNALDAKNVLQVIVEFQETNAAGSAEAKYHSFPADQVHRIAAAPQPPPAEVQYLRNCLNIDWFRKEIRGEDHFDEEMEVMKSRTVFKAAKGYTLLAADYCQIELRLLAHFSQDEELCQAFHQGEDVFCSLTAQWKKKPVEEVSADERNCTKQVCYAVIYGAGPKLVAEQAGVTVQEAEQLFADFLSRFPGLQGFITSTKASCAEQGYVETLLGRRRALPQIHSTDASVKARGERQAVNTLCQGSAADLIKLAMINIHCKLEELSEQRIAQGMPLHFHSPRCHPGAGLYRAYDDVRLVLQVHDELIYEVRPEDLPEVSAIVKHCMESALMLAVPLTVKLSQGESWGDLTVIESKTEAERRPEAPDVLASTIKQDCSIHHFVEAGYLVSDAKIVKNLFGNE